MVPKPYLVKKMAEAPLPPTCLVPAAIMNACWLENGMISKILLEKWEKWRLFLISWNELSTNPYDFLWKVRNKEENHKLIRKKIISNRNTVENFRIHINSGMLILNSVMFNLLKVKNQIVITLQIIKKAPRTLKRY